MRRSDPSLAYIISQTQIQTQAWADGACKAYQPWEGKERRGPTVQWEGARVFAHLAWVRSLESFSKPTPSLLPFFPPPQCHFLSLHVTHPLPPWPPSPAPSPTAAFPKLAASNPTRSALLTLDLDRSRLQQAGSSYHRWSSHSSQ